ncbi:NADP dehydrogenase [ubiquinone] 1 alpha subcomplex subunit 11 [Biomphalaria glabrata]|nr:dehydrogenase [ubiquinone] 1 alpha subcomplex subunit 11-like [Biomphalaria glabrata]
MQSEPRYNTDVSTEHFFKYREKPRPRLLSKLVIGSDRDVIQRVVDGSKAGAFFAAASAAMVYTLEPKGQTLTVSRGIERIVKHSPPFFISGLTYGLAVGMSAKIRNKDGPLNHIIGGIASGTMFGSWYKSPAVGVTVSIVLATLGGVYKAAVDGNYLALAYPRRPRVLNMYKMGWLTERPDQEGIQDADKDDVYKYYKP